MSSEQQSAADDTGLEDESVPALVGVGAADTGAVDDGDLTGRLLSQRYQIEGMLGSGGMGTVYRAEHTLMKKTVAVKVLHPDVVGHGEAVERFRREAQAAAHIDHPNICVATDFGEMDEGGFFLVMEYLEGNTLDETLVCVERFAPGRAMHVTRQICSALTQAHGLGIIHRDLKPENVMLVARDGERDVAKIMDFGVARVRIGEDGADAKITQAGRVYGTPHYMSPEQAAGAEGIDHRADLYSLGVMLFEMLTGTLPFVDKNPAKVMAMHLTEEPPSVRKRTPEARVPRRLDNLVQRLMAKDPEDRPASAEEVARELDKLAERGSSESWMAFTLEAADTSSEALRQVASEVRPQFDKARSWVNDNSIVRGVAMGGFALLLAGLLAAPIVYMAWPKGQATSPEARQQEALNLSEEREQFLEELDASNLVSILATGDANEAIERLDGLIEEHGEEAHLHFLQGRAQAIAGDWDATLVHYQAALEYEPRYASEDRLVSDILDRFTEGSDAQIELAEQILIESIPEQVVNDRLSALARLGESSSVRRRAKAALEDHGRLQDLELWNRASIELRFARGCQAHRDQIDALVESGDERALEILYFYDRQPKRGCGTFKREDCYGCIRGDLSDAIAALERPNPQAEQGVDDSAEAAQSSD